jgi:hypothetical protein
MEVGHWLYGLLLKVGVVVIGQERLGRGLTCQDCGVLCVGEAAALGQLAAMEDAGQAHIDHA